MAFSENDLMLSPDRAAQLTKALSNLNVVDPLQNLCDEAAADVARLTTGYVIDPMALRGFTRALVLYRAYSYAGPVPKDVQTSYDSAVKELEAIAQGNRPNLPKVVSDSSSPGAGSGGSSCKLTGRIPGQI